MNIHFCNKLPKVTANVIDLSGEYSKYHEGVTKYVHFISLTSFFIQYEDVWKVSFIDALGAVNKENAGLYWWAYNTSAKNFLSSNLGKEVYQILAIRRFIERDTSGLPLYIVGASQDQKSILGKAGRTFFMQISAAIRGVLRNIYHAFRSLFFLVQPAEKHSLDILFFSYVLKPYIWGKDPFFGELIKDVEEQKKHLSTKALLYANASFSQSKKFCGNQKNVALLFSNLTFGDIISALWGALYVAPKCRFSVSHFVVERNDFSSLLASNLLNDIRSGNYFFNLLVHKSVQRVTKQTGVKKIIYPYENKSLEKMLLMAAREASKDVYCIGYQHSSVTPRHTTLFFSKEEASCTPLPDEIITLGVETKAYLEEQGNYPKGILKQGCALRQKVPAMLNIKHKENAGLKVFLALSSSKSELIDAVRFCEKAHIMMPDICFAIRPHPEFPLAMLPQHEAGWVRKYVTDFSQSLLEDNILWADICIYISSTVALEAMLHGKTVINLRLNDVIDPDPVLKSLEGVWKVFSPSELVGTLAMWSKLDETKRSELSYKVHAYAKKYFVSPSQKYVSLFVGEDC